MVFKWWTPAEAVRVRCGAVDERLALWVYWGGGYVTCWNRWWRPETSSRSLSESTLLVFPALPRGWGCGSCRSFIELLLSACSFLFLLPRECGWGSYRSSIKLLLSACSLFFASAFFASAARQFFGPVGIPIRFGLGWCVLCLFLSSLSSSLSWKSVLLVVCFSSSSFSGEKRTASARRSGLCGGDTGEVPGVKRGLFGGASSRLSCTWVSLVLRPLGHAGTHRLCHGLL